MPREVEQVLVQPQVGDAVGLEIARKDEDVAPATAFQQVAARAALDLVGPAATQNRVAA